MKVRKIYIVWLLLLVISCFAQADTDVNETVETQPAVEQPKQPAAPNPTSEVNSQDSTLNVESVEGDVVDSVVIESAPATESPEKSAPVVATPVATPKSTKTMKIETQLGDSVEAVYDSLSGRYIIPGSRTEKRSFDPRNITELNSTKGDFSPYISLAGDRIYFSSSREGGEGGDDIWYVDVKNDKYSKPINFGSPVNSKYNEGSISFSSDGRFCYFTVCGRPDSYGGCDIYRSEFKNGEWTRPKNLGKRINSKGWDGHPWISADGRWLYFSSEKYSGFGSRDLYRAPIGEGHDIGKAQNLGFPINNARDQVSPALHPDGKTLYFSSSGHGGQGGLDIMKTKMNDMGKFEEPKPLNPPVNTKENDYFFAIPLEGDLIYFSSSRMGGYGGNDIYTYPLEAEMRPDVVATLRGQVIDQETKEAIEAKITVEDMESGELLFDQMNDPITGEFIVVLPAGRKYGISVSADEYLFSSQNYEIVAKEGYQTLDQIFELPRIKRGSTVTLNNLFFYFGKAELRPESYPELNRVDEILRKYTDMTIEVRGYTDTIGEASFNEWLSTERANSVKKYLVDKGIPSNRIATKGFGEIQSATLRSSRRVEFHISDVLEVVPVKKNNGSVDKPNSTKNPDSD